VVANHGESFPAFPEPGFLYNHGHSQFLANYLPLNGQTTKMVSDKYPVLFTPAPYVFAIWGVIYLLLLVFVVYTLVNRGNLPSAAAQISPAFQLTCLVNALWIFAWHYDALPLSLALMLILLAALIYIRVVLTNGANHGLAKDDFFIRLPFSVYLGWISVATIANVSAVLYAYGWSGWGIDPVIWTAIMIAIGALLALIALAYRNDAAYSAIFIWAFSGIAIKVGIPLLIRNTAVLTSLLILVSLLYSIRPQARLGAYR
jgi:translocator protein